MMKKRILASSMASVMALSSVSVVAFADEKTKDYGEAVSKADLQAYIDSLSDFVANELDNYGITQAADFQNAVDHAQTVLDDDKAAATDYSAAYQMLKATYSKLEIYSAAQLEALIKENKAKYEKNNIMNEDLQDLIYKADTFATFAEAYEKAENSVDSSDARTITEAYVELEKAEKGLEELDSVVKSDFRTVLKKYEAIELASRDYESWRRGKISVVPATSKVKDVSNLKKVTLQLSDVLDIVYKTSGFSSSTASSYKYWDGSTLKTVDCKDKNGDNTTWIGGVDISSATLKDAITNQYKSFDYVKGAVSTTDTDIVAAYKAAVDAVNVFESWAADSYKSGSKSTCATLEKKYHNQLVFTYDTTLIGDSSTAGSIAKAFADLDSANKWEATIDSDKFTIKSKSACALVVDPSGKVVVGPDDAIFKDAAAAQAAIKADASHATYAEGSKVQKVAAKVDVVQYFNFASSKITSPTAGSDDEAVKKALENYELYAAVKNWKDNSENTSGKGIAEAQTAMNALADGKTIPSVSGSNAEWTLIWRKLAYALEDKFPVKDAATKYTLNDLKKLYEKAYELCEETGDAAAFHNVHSELVDARQDAIDWYTAAKATTGFKADSTKIDKSTGKVDASGTSLDFEYSALETKVKNVEKKLADFVYSYGEIRTKIGEIAIAIDDGKVAGDDLKKALAQCAYDLSVLEASTTKDGDDNSAFDSDRVLDNYNRLKTGKNQETTGPNDFEKNLKKSYEALVKAYDEAKNADKGVKNDFDGSGKTDIKDVEFLLDAVLEGKSDTKYDVNGDGKFDINDVEALLNIVLA